MGVVGDSVRSGIRPRLASDFQCIAHTWTKYSMKARTSLGTRVFFVCPPLLWPFFPKGKHWSLQLPQWYVCCCRQGQREAKVA